MVRLPQVNDRQHHEYEGLQRDHKYVEHGPAEMQRQLPESEQRDQYEDDLARVHVAEEPQRERNWFVEERCGLENEIEDDDDGSRDDPDAFGRRRDRMHREFLGEADRTLDLDRVENRQKENRYRHTESHVDVVRRHYLGVLQA